MLRVFIATCHNMIIYVCFSYISFFKLTWILLPSYHIDVILTNPNGVLFQLQFFIFDKTLAVFNI